MGNNQGKRVKGSGHLAVRGRLVEHLFFGAVQTMGQQPLNSNLLQQPMKSQKQRNAQRTIIATAEQDLLALSEEELQNSSPVHPPTSAFIAGWLQSPVDTYLHSFSQPQNVKQHYKSLLKEQRNRNTLTNHAQTHQNKTHLKFKLDEYSGTDFSDLNNQLLLTSNQISYRQDFVRGQKIKGATRKILNSKLLYWHSTLKKDMRASQTRTSRTVDMHSRTVDVHSRTVDTDAMQKRFRITRKTNKSRGLSLITYPLQEQLGCQAQKYKMNLRLKSVVKKNTASL